MGTCQGPARRIGNGGRRDMIQSSGRPQCCGPIAQLDRAFDYESRGREFESSWARHSPQYKHRMQKTRTLTASGFCFFRLCFLQMLLRVTQRTFSIKRQQRERERRMIIRRFQRRLQRAECCEKMVCRQR